jgi:hypothetical protein
MEIMIGNTLAEALRKASGVAKEQVLKHSDLEAGEISLLKKAGFLTPVIRGWYLLSKPEVKGTTTVWFIGFWPFLKCYLEDRFKSNGYCLGADASLDLHVGEGHISAQIIAVTKKISNQIIRLPHDTSLMLYSDENNFPEQIEVLNGISVMSLPLAICRLSPSYFRNKPLNIEIALKMLASISEVSRVLLETGSVAAAGRIAGALREIGAVKDAEQIIKDMASAGYPIKEVNPFDKYNFRLSSIVRLTSPYVGRIEAMWKQMRKAVLAVFPKAPGIGSFKGNVIDVIKERYEKDAYHSLSIEGYRVTEELIHKIASGKWDPLSNAQDEQQKDAMAAKGYDNAFKIILKNIGKVIKGEDSGVVFEDNLHNWYRELFSPGVQAGLMKAAALSGYRNEPVYITGSRHVPIPKEAVPDAMALLFKLLKEEKEASVRAVLGHFIFVYIHPYMDGNGRIARFLMNLMLVSGGYEWTVIRSTRRLEYMNSLEEASIKENIRPFAKFVRTELYFWTKGKAR